MAKRQRDCVDCGAPVGFATGCTAAGACAACGNRRRKHVALTAACTVCWSRTPAGVGCAHAVASTVVTPCARGDQRAVVQDLPPQTRAARPAKNPVLVAAGPDTRALKQVVRPVFPAPTDQAAAPCLPSARPPAPGLELCSPCYQRNLDRPLIRAENLMVRLAQPPDRLGAFAAYFAARHCGSKACGMITVLGRLLTDEQSQLSAGRAGTCPKTGLVDGITGQGVGGLFHRPRAGAAYRPGRAAGRRQRRVDAVPERLRPARAAARLTAEVQRG